MAMGAATRPTPTAPVAIHAAVPGLAAVQLAALAVVSTIASLVFCNLSIVAVFNLYRAYD